MSQETEHAEHGGIRARGEEALGDLAQTLLENSLLNQALATALGAGERAARAQKSAMTALNLPSSTDVERIDRRLRSISERLDEIEDRVDEMADEVAALRRERLAVSEGTEH